MHENVEYVFGGSRPMLELIEQIYAAAQDETLWQPVLRQTAALIGGESIALFAKDSGKMPVDLLSVVDMEPDVWDRFATYYTNRNLIMERCERQLSPEETWFSHAVCSDAELDRSEFGADFFGPSGMHYSVGIRLLNRDGIVANLSCQRARHAGPFDDVADAVYRTLRPHLGRALSLRQNLMAMKAQTQGLQSALEAYDRAVIGLDGTGRVVLCSESAQTLLKHGDCLRLRGNRLVCQSAAENALLQRILQDALLPKQGDAHGGKHAMVLHAADGGEMRVSVFPHRRVVEGQAAVAALVYLSDSRQVPASRRAVLTDLYALTPTEARVADMLGSGLDVKEVAEALRMTHETARYYVKSVLKKTGTRRQAELLRLLLSLPGQ